MDAVSVEIFVLNFNGAALLAECLPSIVEAARTSLHRCTVTVVDNGSTDESHRLLSRDFPEVRVLSYPNDGLCSLNRAVAQSTADVALLLNNDIRLDRGAVDPLIDPILASRRERAAESAGDPILWTAPRCYLFDGTTYEGFRTAVRMHRGLVQATALFAGCERTIDDSGETASAGAALAVDRAAFTALGGFDSVFLPGRIEDLDFAFRAFLAGYRGWYVPQAVAYHRGAASFGPAFGTQGCDRLALRNTLVFQWLRLRSPAHRAAQAVWLPIRAWRDVLRAPFIAPDERWTFLRAAAAAVGVVRKRSATPLPASSDRGREREHFQLYAPARLRQTLNERREEDAWRRDEARRGLNYPLSQLWLRPTALRIARALRPTRVRPWHVTVVGLTAAVFAGAALWCRWPGPVVAAGILAAWLCDRVDGPLARLRRTADRFGAWLDANIDEAVDLGLHTVAASLIATTVEPARAWGALIGFIFGKYLLMYGLAAELEATGTPGGATEVSSERTPWLRRLYHLPANADVRIHLFAAAAAFGLLWYELAFFAVYYNVRWPVRYVLVARRLARSSVAGAAA